MVAQRGDPPAGLHRIVDRSRAVTEERSSRVDVRHDVSHPPESGRTLACRIRRTDDFDDHFPESEEDLPDWSSAEFAVPLPSGGHTDSGERLDRPTEVG